MAFFNSRPYSIRKSRRVMKTGYDWYRTKGKQLTADQLAWFETHLKALDQAILAKNRQEADRQARELEAFCQTHFSKSIWNYTTELVFAILVALVIAIVIRQMWFELYEIPTGSMRPTFKEQDHLTVTKTAFGLNIPLMTKHFYFDPKLVQRTSVVIWSGDNVPFLDSDSTFMKVFPYTKRFIKRCMGKAGDTIYFYGGKIYGFDKEGRDLIELRDNPWTHSLEYVPFNSFEGRTAAVQEPRHLFTNQILFYHFNHPTGRLIAQDVRGTRGEVFNGKEWIKDQPDAQSRPHSTIQTYSDFIGIRNFAIARLLNSEQVETLTTHRLEDMEKGLLYLELFHTPSLTYPSPQFFQRFGISIPGFSTLIPLQEQHLKALMDYMYTSRFVVRDGLAERYRLEDEHPTPHYSQPKFTDIPNGTYEFYYGKAVKVNWGGITQALPADHPLYSLNPIHVQRLFNVGIDMRKDAEPREKEQYFFPSRYAYFRDGDLYIMGGAIFKKDDPLLIAFHEREKKREADSTNWAPYVAFKDYGPPLTKTGALDKEFIQTFGYKIPEGRYLMLGDNHAGSKDSRYFGTIPATNLQGAPSLIIWPPGSRWGIPNQKPYPLLTLPRLIVWSIVLCILALWYSLYRRRLTKPIFKEKINQSVERGYS
jgi:signal peptidase I